MLVRALIATPAAATPGKSPQWTVVLVGTCNRVPATVYRSARPRANRVKHVTGKMGVGRLFETVNPRTGETIVFGLYGSALEHANQPIVTCVISRCRLMCHRTDLRLAVPGHRVTSTPDVTKRAQGHRRAACGPRDCDRRYLPPPNKTGPEPGCTLTPQVGPGVLLNVEVQLELYGGLRHAPESIGGRKFGASSIGYYRSVTT